MINLVLWTVRIDYNNCVKEKCTTGPEMWCIVRHGEIFLLVGRNLLEAECDGLLVGFIELIDIEPHSVSTIIRLDTDRVVVPKAQRSFAQLNILTHFRGLGKYTVEKVTYVPGLPNFLDDCDEPSTYTTIHLNKLDPFTTVRRGKKKNQSIAVGNTLATIPDQNSRSKFLHDLPP